MSARIMRAIGALLAAIALLFALASPATAGPADSIAKAAFARSVKNAADILNLSSGGNSSAITSLQNRVTTNEGSISTLSGLASANASAITALQTRATTDEAQISTNTATLTSGLKTSVSLTIVGQSNEHGNVAVTDRAAWPQAFQSLRNPVVQVPLTPAITLTGGWLPKLYDDLWDYGYDTQIVNAAVGSMSMLTQAAGYEQFRNAGSIYYAKRAPSSACDRGYVGSVMSPDGTSVWIALTGNMAYAFNCGPSTAGDAGFGATAADYTASLPVLVGVNTLRNFVTAGSYTANLTVMSTSMVVTGFTGNSTVHTSQAITNANLPAGTTVVSGPANGGAGTYVLSQAATATASATTITETPPTFTNAVGTVVLDGDIRWQCIATTTSSPYANAGSVMTETQRGWGFDPYGILQRAHEETMRVRGVSDHWALLQNGQGDVGNSTAQYQGAITSAASFFLNRGYKVLLGFTNFSPATSGTLTNWTNLETGRNNALSALQAAFPGKVFAGADLFALMGQTGPLMGGAKVTGSISGSTLTISTTAQGAVEVGQNVWNGTVLVGTITAGSGTSWTLSNAVATSSTALVVAGTYFQYDGVHLNGQGAIAAGALEAAAFKAALGKSGFRPVSYGYDLPRAANDNQAERIAA